MSILADQIVTWYFDNFDQSRVAQLHNRSPKHNDEMWALLLAKAISSFSQGLEDKIDPDNRRASKNISRNEMIDLVGKEAYNKITYLVTAAAMKRLSQAGTVGSGIVNLIKPLLVRYDEIYKIYNNFISSRIEDVGIDLNKEFSTDVGVEAVDSIPSDAIYTNISELVQGKAYIDKHELIDDLRKYMIKPLIKAADILEGPAEVTKINKLIADANKTISKMVDEFFEERPDEILAGEAI